MCCTSRVRRRPASETGEAEKENAGGAGCALDADAASVGGPASGGQRGGEAPWTKKPEYGRVPAYLLDIKLQLAQQRAAEQARTGRLHCSML